MTFLRLHLGENPRGQNTTYGNADTAAFTSFASLNYEVFNARSDETSIQNVHPVVCLSTVCPCQQPCLI